MVYESSTRRIYSSSSPRPVISTSYSYSPLGPIPVVTKIRRQPHLVLAYTPGTSKGHVINPLAIPRVAHRRLVSVSPPPHRALNGQNYYDMLESGISGNCGNRIILFRYRPTPPPVQQSKVLYIEDVTDPSSYGKETRLLRRELSPSPSPSLYYGSPWDTTPAIIPVSRPLYSLHNIPLRSASEVKEIADLRRLYVRERNPDVGYSPLNKALMYRMPMPVYVDPTLPQSYYIGRGNLACLSFAGGRPIPKRRRFYPDYYEDKIRDEVIFRSFYNKLRDAAAVGRKAGKRPIYQPIYYSKKTILGEENVPKREPKESKWVQRAMANEKPPTPRPNKAQAKPSSVATETVVVPPRKESLKMERTPATPPPVQPVNVTLPGPRKSITEIIKEDLPSVVTLPEEKVTVKMPKEPEPAPPTPPVEAEETVVVPSKAEQREATPPPAKEPTPPPAKEPTPPPAKEPTPPPPAKEPTPPPAKEPTPPPPAKEPTPPPPAKEPTPPPAKEPTPPPPAKEPTPPPAEEPAAPPAPQEAAEPAPAPQPAAEEPAAESPAPVAETVSEPASEISAPAAAASEQVSHDEASNKGEVEDIQLDDEITLDEVCDVEENDLQIESDDPEANPSAAESVDVPLPVESPQVTEGSSADEPAKDQDSVPPASVSIVVADIDGPIPPMTDAEATAVQEEPLTVEQIQAEAERRRIEFSQLLDEHAELVTTVKKLEKVAIIVGRSCAEALLAQQEQQPPPSSTSDSQKSKKETGP